MCCRRQEGECPLVAVARIPEQAGNVPLGLPSVSVNRTCVPGLLNYPTEWGSWRERLWCASAARRGARGCATAGTDARHGSTGAAAETPFAVGERLLGT